MAKRNLVKEGPSNSQPARLPAISIPASADPALRQTLEAIKERLEVREGARGNPFERAVTLRDLETQGITRGGVAVFGRSGSGSDSGSGSGPSAGRSLDFSQVQQDMALLRKQILDLPLTRYLKDPIDTVRVEAEVSRLNSRVEAILAGLNINMAGLSSTISADVYREAIKRQRSVATEAAVRADQISIEARQRLVGVQEAANAALAAAIAADNERVDREAAVAVAKTELYTDIQIGLSAEAGERTLLAAQMRGGYTGEDLGLVTTGLLYQERIARATQDDALALQVTLLAAGVGEQFDWSDIWYFDNSIEGWGGNGSPSAVAGFLRPANQATGAYVASPAGLALDASRYKQVRFRVRKVGAPVFAGYLWWNALAQSWDVARRIDLVEPTYDVNGIGVLTLNLEWAGLIDQVRLDLSSTQTEADYFEIDWFAVGRPAPGASTAQILEEQEARATAIEAQATARETLATTILGQADPTGLTLGNLTQGLIFDERVSRSTQVGAVASDLSLLSASVTTLDGDVVTLAGTVTSLSEVVADVESVTASTTQELLVTRKKLDIDAETALRNTLANQNTITATSEDIAFAKQELTTKINDDVGAEAAARLLLLAQVEQTAASVISEQTARADGDSALAADISALTVTVGSNAAAITSEQTARVDADGALATSVSALASRVDSSDAAIVNEQTARADGDTALSTSITGLIARVDDADAAVVSEQTARADGDSALASDITALSAAVGDNAAAILTEQAARVDGDSANATSITSLTARLDGAGGPGVSVEQKFIAQASSIGGLEGQYSVKIDVNGSVAGFGLSNTAPTAGVGTSAFVVSAAKFAVTSTTPGVGKVPFAINTGTNKINFTGDVAIDGNLVVTGTLNANRIVLGSITADQIAGGTITANLISSAAILTNAITANSEAGQAGVTVNNQDIKPAILGNNFQKGAGSTSVFKGGVIGHAILNSATNAGAVGVAGIASDGGVGRPAYGVRGEVANGSAGSAGVLGYARSGSSTPVGVRGVAAITGLSGFGVVGSLEGGGTSGTAAGVYAQGFSTTPALQIDGRILWRTVAGATAVNIDSPPNNTTTFLRADGQWAAPPVPAAPIEVERLISKRGNGGVTAGNRFYAYWTGTTLEFWVDTTRIISLTPSTQAVTWG